MSALSALIINSIYNDGGVDFLNINNSSKHIDNDFGYEYKNPNITRCFYNEELKIFIKSENQEKTLKKSVVDIGTNENADIILAQNETFRLHARLYFEDSSWFIADLGSTDGVWINETKLEPKIKYELFSNDVIDIAHEETFTFFKSQYNGTELIEDKQPKSVNIVKCDKGHYYDTNKVDVCPYCSNSKNRGELVNTLIDNKYRLITQIGKAGFTKIYLAKDVNINKMWAVKVCDKSKIKNVDIINAMIGEASMVQRLDHTSIPHIIEVIDNEDLLCVVEDYVEGESFETIIKEYGKQPSKLVLEWAMQLCDVLAYLHSQHPFFVYRDVKPANIILQPNGKIVLLDFGITRTYKPNHFTDTVSLETKGYAAPEQYGARQTDARTDVYWLGMTMHQLLTGNATNASSVILPIRQLNPELPEGLERIVNKCIELDTEKRYQSINELYCALETFKRKFTSSNGLKRLFNEKKKSEQVKNPKKIICNNCGQKNEANSSYCLKCGTKLHNTSDLNLEKEKRVYYMCPNCNCSFEKNYCNGVYEQLKEIYCPLCNTKINRFNIYPYIKQNHEIENEISCVYASPDIM